MMTICFAYRSVPRSGILRTQKLKTSLSRTRSSKVLSTPPPLKKPGVVQNIAIDASPTARGFFL